MIMTKKKYKKPVVESVTIDNEISLIMMTYGDKDNPPPPPPIPAAANNPFQENAFQGDAINQK